MQNQKSLNRHRYTRVNGHCAKASPGFTGTTVQPSVVTYLQSSDGLMNSSMLAAEHTVGNATFSTSQAKKSKYSSPQKRPAKGAGVSCETVPRPCRAVLPVV